MPHPSLSHNSVYQGSHCSTYILLLSFLCVNYLRRLYDYSDESYIWTRFSQLLLNINICQKIKILISWVCHDAKVPDTTTFLGSFCSQSSFFVILCEPRKKMTEINQTSATTAKKDSLSVPGMSWFYTKNKKPNKPENSFQIMTSQ